MPRVDIALPAYNAERFIKQTLVSISRQTYTNFKCFVVNDGSTDQTLKIITEHASADDRFIVINRENQGMAASLNEVNLLSQADYIARIDADDVMNPNRIEAQLNYFEKHPDTDVLASVGHYINDKGSKIGKIYSDFIDPRKIDEHYASGNLVGLLHPSVMYKRELVTKLGGYRGQFWPSDDVDLWGRLYEIGANIRVIDTPLIEYRIHGTSAITTKFLDNRMQYRWARACYVARKNNVKEPSYEEFFRNHRITWNSKRKDFAKLFYRNAGFMLALSGSTQKGLGILYLLGSAILDPKYVIKKIRKQILL